MQACVTNQRSFKSARDSVFDRESLHFQLVNSFKVARNAVSRHQRCWNFIRDIKTTATQRDEMSQMKCWLGRGEYFVGRWWNSEASFRGPGGPSPPRKKKKKKEKKEKREKKWKKRKRKKKEKKKEGNYEWRQITTYKVLFFPIFQ